MRRPSGVAVLAVAAGMFLSGCYGPFLLTRKVWNWNGEVSDNKWVVEVVYLLTAHLLPVYGIAMLADAIIFNSVEFWTGENWLTESNAQGVSHTKRIVRGDSEAVLTRTGDRLQIEQFKDGVQVSSLRMQRQGNTTLAYDGNDALLFTAQTLPDGQVLVTDASGRHVATYTEEDARKFLASVPRN